MGGARIAVYALLLLAALVLVDWGFQSSTGTAARDTNLVYCLQPPHQGDLVNAAVSLGLAGSGSTIGGIRVGGRRLTLAQWRAADRDNFTRACDALAADSRPTRAVPGSSGTGQVLAILVPVIAGALLTLAADDFRQASDRRWVQADQLRADWKAFHEAVRSYAGERLDAGEGIPSSGDVDETRRTLTSALRKIQSQHRKSPTIRNLRALLSEGALGAVIADDDWTGDGNPPAIDRGRERLQEIEDSLNEAESYVEKVADALERRLWLSSKP